MKFAIDSNFKTASGADRPKPAARVKYPISIIQVSCDSAECPVFGKQIDIMTTSLRPLCDIHR
jgi:hypothetical protein